MAAAEAAAEAATRTAPGTAVELSARRRASELLP